MSLSSSSTLGSSHNIRRSPVTNVRHENRENKLTKVGKSGILYADDKILGHGATSIVYEGLYKKPKMLDRQAAIKRVFSEYVELCKEEIKIWQQITNSAVTRENLNIVQLYHWTCFKENGRDCYYFAMEMATSDLETWITSNNWERSKCVAYLKDAADGLSWLHSKRVIHRDVKPANILIFSQQGNTNIAKLGDFGISKTISTLSKTSTNTDAKGTLDWLAPEAITALKNNRKFSSTYALDIFSFGVTISYAMSRGKHPFEKRGGLSGVFICMNILDFDITPESIGNNNEWAANHLCQWMMNHVPNGRPKIRQVTRHPFFWDVKKQLGFVLDVAKSLDLQNDPGVEKIKKEMDKEYCEIKEDFNWRAELGDEVDSFIFERRSGTGAGKSRKKSGGDGYAANSVSMLIKLIRDKYVHHADIVEKLICEEYFGRWIAIEDDDKEDNDGEWVYCEEKYGTWFFERFPELVMFLFWFLVKTPATKELKSMAPVKWNYDVAEYPAERFPDVADLI